MSFHLRQTLWAVAGLVKCGYCCERKGSEDCWWCSECGAVLCSRCGLGDHLALGHPRLSPWHSHRALEEAHAYLKATAKRNLDQQEAPVREKLQVIYVKYLLGSPAGKGPGLLWTSHGSGHGNAASAEHG